jgi:integrase
MALKLVKPRGTRKCYAIRGTVNGERIERSTGFTTRREAEAYLKKAQRELAEDRLRMPSDPTFASATMKYLRDNPGARFIDKLLEEVGDTPLKLIDQDFIDDLAHKLYPDASPATRNRQVFTPVIAIMRSAGISKLIRRPKGAQGEARTAWLWPEDAGKLAKAAHGVHPELAILIVLILSTGARLSEALGLRCTDIRITEKHAFVPKTKNGQPRSLYLPPAAIDALLQHPRGLKRDGKLFPWSKGSYIYKLAGRAYEAAGIDDHNAPFHILRHTYGTWMRRYSGAGEADLIDTGAWQDADSVRRYAHAVQGDSHALVDKMPVPRIGYPVARRPLPETDQNVSSPGDSGNTQKTPADGCLTTESDQVVI